MLGRYLKKYDIYRMPFTTNLKKKIKYYFWENGCEFPKI